MKIEKVVKRWMEAGILDSITASRIVEFESKRKVFSFSNMLIGLAGLAIFLGIAAIIGANWAAIPANLKISCHVLLNGAVAVFLYRFVQSGQKKTIWFDLMVALLAGLTLTFIALVGQVYQTQEPTWKALVLWLVLVTPFWLWLAESSRLVRLWILSFVVTYGFFIFGDAVSGLQARALWISLLPFIMIAVGQNQTLRKIREITPLQISLAGFALIAVGTSFFQFAWQDHNWIIKLNADMFIYLRTALVAYAAAMGIIIARRRKLLVDMPPDVDIFLVLSVIVGAAPFLIPHQQEIPVVGAVVMMAYWAFCGWVGLKAGYPRALNIASILIAIRLIVVYIEVFGSLLQTGVGLIISGVLLIGLVYGTRRAMAYFERVRLGGKS